MEVVNPNRDIVERFPSGREESRRRRMSEFEEIKDQVARLVMMRSISVPENMLNLSDDSNSSSGSDSPRRGEIRSRSISSQGLVRMVVEDDDNKDEDQSMVLPNTGKYSSSMFWVGGDDPDEDSLLLCHSSSDDDYTELNGMDDLEQREHLFPPQIPGFLGRCYVRVEGREEESVFAAFLKDVKLALEEFKRQKGVDYEFVKSCGVRLTSPSDPEDDSCDFGMHMNFWAKLEGCDSSPEYFFASFHDGEVHCCKLNYDANLEGIQHCEHIKCLECGLWTRKKAL